MLRLWIALVLALVSTGCAKKKLTGLPTLIGTWAERCERRSSNTSRQKQLEFTNAALNWRVVYFRDARCTQKDMTVRLTGSYESYEKDKLRMEIAHTTFL